MADQNLRETSRVDQPNRLQVSEKRKRCNWLRSIVAGAGMLAVSLPRFDSDFFFLVDRLLSTLRAIAAVIRPAYGGKATRTLPTSSVPQRSSRRSPALN